MRIKTQFSTTCEAEDESVFGFSVCSATRITCLALTLAAALSFSTGATKSSKEDAKSKESTAQDSIGHISDQDIDLRVEPLTTAVSDTVTDTVLVTLRSFGTEIAAFDFTFAYDPGVVDLVEAVPGEFILKSKWEYFTQRRAPRCDGPCPAGLIKVVALAQYGLRRPEGVTFLPDSVAILVKLVVRRSGLISDEHVQTPVSFFWVDCGDNSISSVSGDELFVSKVVTDPQGVPVATPEDKSFPTYSGFSEGCNTKSRPNKPVPKIRIRNGLIRFTPHENPSFPTTQDSVIDSTSVSAPR